MNRFIKIGETTPPCGVPRCRGICSPSVVSNGAVNHRSRYSSIHRSLIWARTALSRRPRLALTCWYASHTARFAMTKGFVDAMSLIPVERVGNPHQPDNAVASLHPRYKGFFATANSSAPRPGIGILPHGVCQLSFPFASETRFSRSVPKPEWSSCRFYTGCRRDCKQVPSQLILEPMFNPGLTTP